MRRTRLKHQSAARRVEQAIRRSLAEQLGRPPCTIRILNVCTGQAEAFHELVGAGQGGSRVDRRNIAPACNRCNQTIEDRPAEAYREGWKVRRSDAVEGEHGLVPAHPNPRSVAAILDQEAHR